MTGTMAKVLTAVGCCMLLTGCATTKVPITAAPSPAVTSPAAPADSVVVAPEPPGILETIDNRHAAAADMAASIVDWVDKIFGEPRIEDRERMVRVKGGVETTFHENGEGNETSVRLNARVPLPALERRTNLFFDIGGDVDQLGNVTSPTYSEAKDTYALAATLLRSVREAVDLGIRARVFWDAGPDLMISPFLRYDHRWDPWRFFVEQRFSYDTEDQWRADTDLDVDRLLAPTFLLRLHNSLRYQLNESGVNLAHGLLLRHPLFGLTGLSWEWWVEHGPGAASDKTYGQCRMRGRIWRKWLEYELRPAYTFMLEDDRDTFFSVFVSRRAQHRRHGSTGHGRSRNPLGG